MRFWPKELQLLKELVIAGGGGNEPELHEFLRKVVLDYVKAKQLAGAACQAKSNAILGVIFRCILVERLKTQPPKSK